MKHYLVPFISAVGMLLTFVLGYNAGLRRAEQLLDEKFPWLKGDVKK